MKTETPSEAGREAFAVETVFDSLAEKAALVGNLEEEMAFISADPELSAAEKFITADRRIRETIGLLQAMKDEAYRGWKAVRS